MKHLPAIDGLRAIAVLAVVAYHAGLPVPAGFVGVDVFFVISGYLITGLLAEKLRTEGRIDFLDFYARRARRILPAMVLVVGAVMLGSLWLAAADQAAIARSALAALAMVGNLHFRGITGGYFDASAEEMPLLHLWSLSVEEQFYVLWPLLLVVLLRRGRGVAALSALAVASLALSEWLVPEAAFYLMPARGWELAAGGLVALRPMALPRLVGPLGLLVVVASLFLPTVHFPGFGALPAVLGSVAVVAAVHNGARLRPLEVRPMVWIGLLSYSLYLWHWPLLAFDRILNLGSGLAWKLALCGVALLLSWATYHLVETPFRRWRPALPKPAVVGGGIGSLLIGMAGAYGLLAQADATTFKPRGFDRCIIAAEADSVRLPPDRCQSHPGKPEVIVWGDSHADAWREFAFAAWPSEPVATYTFSACPPALGYRTTWAKYPKHGPLCEAFNERVLSAIGARRPHTVVLGMRWAPEYHAGVERTVAALGKVPEVIVMAPTPELEASPRRCVERGADCSISREAFDRRAERARTFLRSLSRYPNVRVVDPADYFCADGRCPVVRNGVVLYRDRDHISPEASAAFAEVFSALP